MAVTFDSSALIFQAANPVSPQTTTIACGAGANRQAACFIFTATAITITGVTIGTDAMALIAGSSVSVGGLALQVWGGAVTVTDTQTISVSFTNPFGIQSVSSVLCSNTDLVTNATTATDLDGTPVSLPITSAAGDLTFSGILHDGTGAPTSSQNRWDAQTAFGITASDFGPGTVTPTHTWTGTGVNWNAAIVTGVNFRQSGGTVRPTVGAASLTTPLAIASFGLVKIPLTP